MFHGYIILYVRVIAAQVTENFNKIHGSESKGIFSFLFVSMGEDGEI